MKKEFATITTLRLDCLHKDKLGRIINAQMQVTARTQAGAIRQMIGKWEALITDIDRLESDNRILREKNRDFTEMIESHVVTAQAMQQIVFERKRRFSDEIKQTGRNLADSRVRGREND